MLANIFLSTHATHVPILPLSLTIIINKPKVQWKIPSPCLGLRTESGCRPSPTHSHVPFGHTVEGRDHCLFSFYLGKVSLEHKAWHTGRHLANAYCIAGRPKENTYRSVLQSSWKKQNSSQILLFKLGDFVYIHIYTQSRNTVTTAIAHKQTDCAGSCKGRGRGEDGINAGEPQTGRTWAFKLRRTQQVKVGESSLCHESIKAEGEEFVYPPRD